MSEEGNEIQAIVSLCGVEPSPTNSGNIVYQGEEWVPLEAYREAMAGWKAANEAQVGEHQSAFDHHYRSACPCVAAERHAETCPKHGHPTHTGEHLAVAKGGGLTPDDEANWLRGDWYERWQDATENADDELMSTLESLRGRVEQTIKAALAERPAMPMPERVLFGEAANLVYRIEAAGHLSHEAQNFERWKADARVLAPRLRHALALLSQDRGEGVEDVVMLPREPTQAMMDAGLYHSSPDSTWADIHTIWKAMFDAVALDGGTSTQLPADPATLPSPASEEREAPSAAPVGDLREASETKPRGVGEETGELQMLAYVLDGYARDRRRERLPETARVLSDAAKWLRTYDDALAATAGTD